MPKTGAVSSDMKDNSDMKDKNSKLMEDLENFVLSSLGQGGITQFGINQVER